VDGRKVHLATGEIMVPPPLVQPWYASTPLKSIGKWALAFWSEESTAGDHDFTHVIGYGSCIERSDGSKFVVTAKYITHSEAPLDDDGAACGHWQIQFQDGYFSFIHIRPLLI
jgi:hypothetical protein